MYFACNIRGRKFENVVSSKLIYPSPQLAIRESLKEYVVDSKILDGNRIMQDCFPQIDDVNVFISHSHNDEDVAIQLANIIYKSCKAKSFIDSMVWDYADELLKDIDNIYCKDKTTGRYWYNSRNRTTAYVHMMLATSLTQMMDKCDCIIFIDTPNSIEQNVLRGDATFSPWIFHELATLHTLRVTLPPDFFAMEKLATDSRARMASFSESRKVDIALPLKREDLYSLKYEDITALHDFSNSLPDEIASSLSFIKLYKQLEKEQKKQSRRIITG